MLSRTLKPFAPAMKRALHSSAMVAAKSSTFVDQRMVYEKELTNLRKQWTSEHEEKLRKEEERKKEMKDKIVLDTAIRLRARRAKKEANLERTRQRRAVAMNLYRETLAKHVVLKSQEHDLAKKRYQQMLADLAEEQKVWITMENMDSLIVPALFDNRAASTGLVTKYSDLWRYYIHPDNFKRLMAEIRAEPGEDEQGVVYPDETYKFRLNDDEDDSWEARRAEVAQMRSQARLNTEESLHALVGTAAERENFKDLVKRYIASSDIDEGALAAGRTARQTRIRKEEEELMYLEDDVDDERAVEPKRKYNNNDHEILEDRNSLIEEFRSISLNLPGETNIAYAALRKHADRCICREDFDDFVDRYVHFLELHINHLDGPLISEVELITNADYLDRLAGRLKKTLDIVNKMLDKMNEFDHIRDQRPQMSKMYTIKLKNYREDWWKYQALLVLAGQSSECSLAEDFPDTLYENNDDDDENGER